MSCTLDSHLSGVIKSTLATAMIAAHYGCHVITDELIGHHPFLWTVSVAIHLHEVKTGGLDRMPQ